MNKQIFFMVLLLFGGCRSQPIARSAEAEIDHVSWWEKTAEVTFCGVDQDEIGYILVDGDSRNLGRVASSFATVDSNRYGRIFVEDLSMLDDFVEGERVVVTVTTADINGGKESLLLKIKHK